MEYQSIIGDNFCEKIIEKSRFLTYVSHVEGEEEAKRFLEKVRSQHPQATHVCYGYVADELGNFQRFSDDGEPQGTAGMPILNALKSRGLFKSAVAVVRYFGGIKLGAGGLTRAYAGCASDGISSAKVGLYALAEEILLEVDYGSVNAAMKFLEGERVLSRDFSITARFRVLVRADRAEDFSARARDFFNGKVNLVFGEKYFYPFV